jgi:hypothetical protein
LCFFREFYIRRQFDFFAVAGFGRQIADMPNLA